MTDPKPIVLEDDEVLAAKKALTAAGYVVLREKSYRQAQERQRVAEVLRAAEQDRREGTERWAHEAFSEQRRLYDRLTFVFGKAIEHGATVDELCPDTPPTDLPSLIPVPATHTIIRRSEVAS